MRTVRTGVAGCIYWYSRVNRVAESDIRSVAAVALASPPSTTACMMALRWVKSASAKVDEAQRLFAKCETGFEAGRVVPNGSSVQIPKCGLTSELDASYRASQACWSSGFKT